MDAVSILVKKRADLEKRIIQLKPETVDIELDAYDVIIAAKHDYQKRKEECKKEIINLVHKASGISVPQDFTSIFSNPEEAINSYGKRFGHAPAYIIILNYDEKNHKHAITAGMGIFNNGEKVNEENPSRLYIRECIGTKFNTTNLEELRKLAYEDLATLVDSQGIIKGTNVHLIDDELIQDTTPLHVRIGLLAGGHSRHFAAASASYLMKDTVVYTLSEGEGDGDDRGYVRRFQGGIVTFSTHKGEDDHAAHKLRFAKPTA
jgi:hypothetical protein